MEYQRPCRTACPLLRNICCRYLIAIICAFPARSLQENNCCYLCIPPLCAFGNSQNCAFFVVSVWSPVGRPPIRANWHSANQIYVRVYPCDFNPCWIWILWYVKETRKVKWSFKKKSFVFPLVAERSPRFRPKTSLVWKCPDVLCEICSSGDIFSIWC